MGSISLGEKMKATVNEVVDVIQGEGKTQGQYRTMIRMNNCSLFCNYCDTAYCWGKGDKQIDIIQTGASIVQLFKEDELNMAISPVVGMWPLVQLPGVDQLPVPVQ